MATQTSSLGCVICGAGDGEGVPIFASRLWDGAEDPSNRVRLCRRHADDARATVLSVEELMERAGLAQRPLPPQLHAVERYDRWGNPLLKEGRRARGELFFEPEVQDWLGRCGALDRFEPWVKYPRTYVLPWSQEIGVGDRPMASLDLLAGGDVIVSEKMDGENVSLYRDFLHTRSIARIPHESRIWLDAFWDRVRYRIPADWRICGEYLFVSHTVRYCSLPSYFLAFSVWNDRNICLSWNDSMAFLADAGIAPVPLLYRGQLDRHAIHAAWEKGGNPSSEGYVLRSAGRIAYRDFRRLAGKFIRSGYVQSEPVKNNMTHGTTMLNNTLSLK
ncbi:RNA ligase family protein [Croceicoccus marinus]|uniref:RNA ligase family protein n=1 Tax=Croceicoccus marinus TaxID=450378 RepID=A0A7G6VZH8_9SPHN|nr:RNA ligase family protein [Croceicoccus marinus]QNE07143.1 RNA ligase family protein [Croceicoccus marinus]